MLTRRRSLAHLAMLGLLPQAGCGGGGGDAGEPPLTAPRFTPDGLGGRIVRRLRPSAAGLVAGTDDGLYRRGEAGWAAIGLQGRVVQDVLVLDGERLLASVWRAESVPREYQLVESRDGGRSWQALAHDFGGSEAPEGIQALGVDPVSGRLFASGVDALAESSDGGRHWRLLAGIWHAFAQPKEALAFDSARGDVWYGGQDAIEGLQLYRWRSDTRERDSHPGLMPAPSVVKGIRLLGAGRVLVSGEGGIVQTRDAGRNWQRLLDADYRFHFDVLQDPQRPTRLLTAHWEKNFDTPQPLVVQVSDDEGGRWQRIEHPDRQLFGGVWSLAVTVERGRAVYHLGLYRGGLMRLELP
jgi:photosystem II stability/assembly factor-like uncharacterized protein